MSSGAAQSSGPIAVRVRYPLEDGELVLRSDVDWNADVLPERVGEERRTFEFELPSDGSYRYFKPLLKRDGRELWARGENELACAGAGRVDVFPHFAEDSSCHVCTVRTVPSRFEERGYDVRVFLPPGYDENALARYPVLYMQDGQNLFFPDEAFTGKHWRVSETLAVLDSMSLIRPAIVVGIYPRDRMKEYTRPGYEDYGRFVATELVPWVDASYRTVRAPAGRAIMGSSLGGVVSLHVAWSFPELFGMVGCMSSTFGFRDDLVERVANDPRRPLRIYLDSGWPSDNYEVTRSMHATLLRRGYRDGRELTYVAFPDGMHDEASWARRAHIPFQFFFRAR